MRQVRLVPSGVQAWHRESIAATGEYFAYSSTMAIHIFRLKDNSLWKMIAAHERAISSICWSLQDSNLIASCSQSGDVKIWDIENEEERHQAKVSEIPNLMDWAPAGDKIALALEHGDIKLWEYTQDKMSKLFSVSPSAAKVLRWHPWIASKLLVGASDGSLHVFDQQTGKRVQITGKAKTSKDPVTDAQWDPLSEDYLLASFQDGSLTLFDASSQREIHSFDKQPQPIKSLAWAKAQPGNFVTSTDRVGVLRLWNVSQRSPLAQVKVGHAGVNCVKAIPGEANWFLLSFKNSAVGVCDIAQRTMRFTSSPGHSETIFDVVFHPEDPDIIATASYDGHVKMWRISTMESHREMYAGKDQILYGLDFGPGATRVCAVSSTGLLCVWHTETGEQLLRLQVHTGHAYRCKWSPRRAPGGVDGAGEIASGAADGNACVVDAITGSVLRRIPHPGPVVGVAWSPFKEGLLATACQDGHVRIFNLAEASMGDQPIVILQGHSQRVFNVAFNPICANILASGSDDTSIRIWDWHAQREVRSLNGHTSYVRGLVWHSELPNILFSGSWDATIRIWDVAMQRCLHVAHEHHADVYGIVLHPLRPFFLVSSSRDTTLRFWIFEDLVRPLVVQALVRPEKFGDLLSSNPEEVSAFLSAQPGALEPLPNRLYGQASRALMASLQELNLQPGQPHLQAFEGILSFFMYRQGIEDLWGLLAFVRGEPPTATSTSSRAIFHAQELIACQKSKALELASQRGTIGVVEKQEERLLKAAQIMLRVGDLRAYCRFTVQAGHWERAICIAPAVSHQFWSELCNEYIDSLSATTDLGEAAPFWVATGQASRLVSVFIERGELDNAFVVAKADSENLLPTAASAAAAAASPAVGSDGAGRTRVEDVAAILASRHADAGEPLQAAMCFLAVSAPGRAVKALGRAHEVVLAYAVARLLGQPVDPVDLKLLALCAERDQRWAVAADTWQQHPQGPTSQLPLLAVRCPYKELAQPWSPWSTEQHQERLAQARAAGDSASAVLAAVCAGDYAQAAELGVQGLYMLFGRQGGWSMQEARAILDPLESLPLQQMDVKDIASILSCAAYVGLVEASQLGYHDLMFPLAQTLRNIVKHQNLQFPVSIVDITLLEGVTCMAKLPKHAATTLGGLLAQPDLPEHVRAQCEQHLAALRQMPQPANELDPADGLGLATLAGGRLPTCYKRYAKNSVLTSQPIRGPAFELEDKQSYVSLSDALAWARVNVFSPLNTGFKICPV